MSKIITPEVDANMGVASPMDDDWRALEAALVAVEKLAWDFATNAAARERELFQRRSVAGKEAAAAVMREALSEGFEKIVAFRKRVRAMRIEDDKR